MNPPRTLNHDEIARRIPHQGNMCLLATVTAWDGDRIECQASSHQAADNPLRAQGRLGAACGVEYAAQAMAVHGALVAESMTTSLDAYSVPRAGYLASIRSVTLHTDRLDTVAAPLRISAERITGDDNTVLYSFAVNAGDTALLSGRAVVVLDASALSLPSVAPG
ncbi:3-hydroxylacyl-ACP dehydratase [Polaromonas eurypsychrophila]|uniref:Phosphotransferase n=1 Tax=Polaromonas eurypsychrophila TaxID=1614635 RepID=A0A916WCF1_9BURK|nr:3-hydroxylacyl-ACP dehydratase [Polaromonas eurypsychrophila]GGA87019.1 phosphotransferase [Polaromonas eurypsychrophila]